MHHESVGIVVTACSRVRRDRVRPDRRLALALVAMLAAFPGVVLAQAGGDSQRPQMIVRDLLDAMRAKSAERIRAVFADDATRAYGPRSPKSGAAFRAWLQSDIIDREGQVLNPRFSAVGNEVVVTGQFRNNANSSSAANFLLKVENGKIISWQMRY